MTDRRDAIAAELERNLDETVSLFRSLSPDELRTQLYSDGAKWTARCLKKEASELLVDCLKEMPRNQQNLNSRRPPSGPGSPIWGIPKTRPTPAS